MHRRFVEARMYTGNLSKHLAQVLQKECLSPLQFILQCVCKLYVEVGHSASFLPVYSSVHLSLRPYVCPSVCIFFFYLQPDESANTA